MKIVNLISALIIFSGVFIAGSFASAETEVMPACNAIHSFCATESAYADPAVTSCVETTTSTSCTASCVNWQYGNCVKWEYYYHADCIQAPAYGGYTGYTCGPWPLEVEEAGMDAATGCSGSGFCGWRDGVNKTGSSAVGNAARAKLHVCNSTGKSAESNWNSDNSACYDAEASYNDHCTTSVWEDLCDGYLPPVKK